MQFVTRLTSGLQLDNAEYCLFVFVYHDLWRDREPGLEPDSVLGDLEPNQEGSSARSADVGPSEPFRYVISYNTTLLRGSCNILQFFK
jgi:hypothetical protein